MLSNDTSVGEKKNKKRSLNSQEYRLSESARMKKLSDLTKKKQTSSSSSVLPPTTPGEEPVNKKMKEAIALRAADLQRIISNYEKRIEDLGRLLLEATISKDQQLEEKLKEQKKDAEANLKENEEKLTKLEDELKQLSQPVPEPCRFFVF